MHRAGLQNAANNGPHGAARHCRTCRRRAARARDIDALEHAIEQGGLPAGSRRVEGLLQSVVEEVRRVDVQAVVQLAAERADVARIQRNLACQDCASLPSSGSERKASCNWDRWP